MPVGTGPRASDQLRCCLSELCLPFPCSSFCGYELWERPREPRQGQQSKEERAEGQFVPSSSSAALDEGVNPRLGKVLIQLTCIKHIACVEGWGDSNAQGSAFWKSLAIAGETNTLEIIKGEFRTVEQSLKGPLLPFCPLPTLRLRFLFSTQVGASSLPLALYPQLLPESFPWPNPFLPCSVWHLNIKSTSI